MEFALSFLVSVARCAATTWFGRFMDRQLRDSSQQCGLVERVDGKGKQRFRKDGRT